MNQSKWIVESTHLRMRPEIEKPLIFGHASTVAAHQQYKEINDFYNKTLASQPTIKRGDNGQWKEGDVLTEGVDFEIQYRYYNGKKWIQTTAFLYEKYLNKREKVAIPKQQESEEKERGITFNDPVGESEDEIWNSVVATVATADICKNVTPGDNDGLIRWKQKVISELKQHYSIKRK